MILDHSKAPRNFRELPAANHKRRDSIRCAATVLPFISKIEGDSIRDISFEGSGCAISKASASMMTQIVKGKNAAQAEELFARFHELVTGRPPASGPAGQNEAELGKLTVFCGVSEFPVRVKCATLAWHTLHAALEGKQEAVSTE